MGFVNSICEGIVIGGIVLLFTAPFIAYVLSRYVFNAFYEQDFEKFKNALKKDDGSNK